MKRAIVVFGVLFVVLGVVRARSGVNPASPGLPPAANVYGAGVISTNNAASALCVDCHTANPKPSSGTHFVLHHDGTGLRLTTNTQWQKLDDWSGGVGTTRRSKYGVPPPPAVPTISTIGAAGHLICESCHNLVRNAGGGNNLLSTFREAADPLLSCNGCHTTQAAGPPAHHPLTGDPVGGDGDIATTHILNKAHSSHVLGTTAAGSEASYTGLGGVNCASCHVPHGAQPQTGARVLKRGYSSIPATVLPNLLGKPVNVIYYSNRPDGGDVQGSVKTRATADVVQGIDRQQDIGVAFPGTRLVVNADPLCDSCHLY